jgi:uncharacterized membrane protein (UPF0182 family)
LDLFKPDPAQSDRVHYTLFEINNTIKFVGLYPALLEHGTGTNLVALYSVQNSFLRDNFDEYGKIIVFRFPKQPTEENRILFYSYSSADKNWRSDERIQKWLKLHTNITMGKFLLYKLGDYWVYIKPFYLKTGTGIVKLEKVVTLSASYNTRENIFYVGWGDTLEESLADFLAQLGENKTTIMPENITWIEKNQTMPKKGYILSDKALRKLQALYKRLNICKKSGDLTCIMEISAKIVEEVKKELKING